MRIRRVIVFNGVEVEEAGGGDAGVTEDLLACTAAGFVGQEPGCAEGNGARGGRDFGQDVLFQGGGECGGGNDVRVVGGGEGDWAVLLLLLLLLQHGEAVGSESSKWQVEQRGGPAKSYSHG